MSTQPSAWEQIAPVMFDDARWAAAGPEVEAATKLMGIDPPARVLDVACGPGRHVLELAARGFTATGLDATEGFLGTARDLAVAKGLTVDVLHADMRDFDADGTFDAAISMATSFGYFEDPRDDERVITNIHRSLRPGGVFLLEILGKEVAARTLRPRTWIEENGTLLLTEQRVMRAWTWMQHRLVFVRGEVQQSFDLGHRLYAASELDELLERAGFSSIELYGSLHGTAYDETAEMLVAVARR